MKMNKNKPHFRVTFSVNSNACERRTYDVWASSPKKALKKAEELIKSDNGVYYHYCSKVEQLSS